MWVTSFDNQLEKILLINKPSQVMRTHPVIALLIKSFASAPERFWLFYVIGGSNHCVFLLLYGDQSALIYIYVTKNTQ